MWFPPKQRILRVDLSSGKICYEKLDELTYRRYLGGGALAAHYLVKELRPGSDPLGPDNILIFAGTILNGTPGPGTGRFSIVAKSPLSGAFGEAKAGGWWATELRRAGFDMVIVHGQATEPVYLWIHDGEAELRGGDRGDVCGRSRRCGGKSLDMEVGGANAGWDRNRPHASGRRSEA